MILWLIRALFVLLTVSLMLYSFNREQGTSFEGANGSGGVEEFFVYQATIMITCAVVLAIGILVDLLVRRKSVAALGGIFFGLMAGLLVGVAFNKVLDLIYVAFNISDVSGFGLAREPISGAINILCCYLAIVFIMETKDDFRFIVPYVEFSKQTKGNCPILLDTSVIIDGRIADIACTKILSAPLVIPKFILGELQNVADSADRLRRNRGRRGLDILNKMRNNDSLDISIQDIALDSSEKSEPIDHQLVSAAIKLSGKVATNDYNLNKVASLRGVDVVNINELANALRPVVLPGETMRVKIVRIGDQPEQGVGYLEDGTMLVVEYGRDSVGKDVNIVVTSALQTSAGRMIFGRLDDEQEKQHQQRPRQGRYNNNHHN